MKDGAIVTLIERVLADAVHRLKAGGIGFVGPDVPIEVLLATQRPFGHLRWRAEGATPFADRFLETSFPFWARSILEQWQAGTFDGIASVVFSRADDASQRLYYYVAELQRRGLLRGPEIAMFDIAHVARASSEAHTVAAIVKLCHVLQVNTAALHGAIEQAKRLRDRLATIDAGRHSDGPLLCDGP